MKQDLQQLILDAAIITTVFETYKEAFLKHLIGRDKKRLAGPRREKLSS
jgi:hypothetical protein